MNVKLPNGSTIDMSLDEITEQLQPNYEERQKEQQEMYIFYEFISKNVDETLNGLQEKYGITMNYSDFISLEDDIRSNLTLCRNFKIETAKKIITENIDNYLERNYNKMKYTKLSKKIYPYIKPTKDGYLYIKKS